MDTVSHGFWGALFWRTDLWLLAVLFSILPDIIAQGPRVLYNLSQKRVFKGMLSMDLPKWITTYTHHAFHLTHSLVVATAVTGVVWAVWGVQLWMLAWHLHIIVDMWSHKKEEATPFLYPFSDFRFHGVHWSSKQFLVPNLALLMSAWTILLL